MFVFIRESMIKLFIILESPGKNGHVFAQFSMQKLVIYIGVYGKY